MARWAKISERIGQDGVLAVLAEENLLAALLFTWSIPAADVYGLLPGDAREYRARVASAMCLLPEQVEEAVQAQVGAGLVVAYDLPEGGRGIYLRRYHRYQSVRWDRTGPPEQALPPAWEVPEELTKFLASDTARTMQRTPAYYGLADSPTCATPGAVRDESGSSPGAVRDESRLDTEQESEYTRVEQSTPTVPASAPIPPTECSDDDVQPSVLPATQVGPPLPESSKAPPETTADDKLLAAQAIIGPDWPALQPLISIIAEENKSGRITKSRRAHLCEDMALLYQEVGRDAWRYGIEEAVKRDIPNVRYAEKAARGHAKRRHQTADSFSGHMIPHPEDFAGATTWDDLNRNARRRLNGGLQ